MKTLEFQKYLGSNDACMKILSIDTKVYGQLKSNDTYFDDSWFNYLKTDEETMDSGVGYCRPVKTSHKGFCLSTL